MSYELEGKLIEKFDMQVISDKFRKREFVIEQITTNYGREFVEQIKFQLTQDKCTEIEPFQVNDSLKVTFNIKGKRWEKNGSVSYFTNLEAWKIEGQNQLQSSDDVPFASTAEIPVGNMPVEDDSMDDLPF